MQQSVYLCVRLVLNRIESNLNETTDVFCSLNNFCSGYLKKTSSTLSTIHIIHEICFPVSHSFRSLRVSVRMHICECVCVCQFCSDQILLSLFYARAFCLILLLSLLLSSSLLLLFNVWNFAPSRKSGAIK